MNVFEKILGPPLDSLLSKRSKEAHPLLEGDPELEEKRKIAIEPLDSCTLVFAKEHIDVLNLGHFDPEWEMGEIKKIYNSVREGQRYGAKHLLMENFKTKLAAFRKNMSLAQLDLEAFLRSNPDAAQQEMLSKVDAILEKNQVQSQEGHFYQAVNKFREARQVVKKVVKQYQEQFADRWPAELFKKLFGRLPVDNVTIDILPASLFFHIHNIADYALAANANEEEVDQSKISDGTLLTHVPAMSELSSKILLENSSMITDQGYSGVTRVHEEEHAIHQTIYPLAVFLTKRKLVDSFFERRGDFNLAALRDALKNLVGLRVDRWERGAKDEILAYLKEGHDLQDKVIKAEFFEKDGLYDYLNQVEINLFTNGIEKSWQEAKGHLQITKEDGTEINAGELKFIALSTIRKAWEQYQQNLARAMEIVSFLLKKYGEDQRPAILRLLSQEPLNKWHRLTKLLS